MSKLNQPTPQKNVFLWKLASVIFMLSIFINENFNLIEAAGLKEKTQTLIRIMGAVVYFIFTYYNFNKSTFDQKTK